VIRPQIQHKNSEHMYLKFVTQVTPSLEKIVDPHGFKQVYKPRNINILCGECGS